MPYSRAEAALTIVRLGGVLDAEAQARCAEYANALDWFLEGRGKASHPPRPA